MAIRPPVGARTERLPGLARTVIGATVLAGGIGAVALVCHFRSSGFGSTPTLVVLGTFVLATWLWQMTMYVGSSSQAHNLDEGFFLVAALVLPPVGVLSIFALAAAVAQAVRRRALVKSTFNLFMELLAISAALAVQHLIAPPGAHLSLIEIVAACLAALTYFGVNSLCVSAVVASMNGVRTWAVFSDGLDISSKLLGTSITFGLVGGVAASSYPDALVLVGASFCVCRKLLSSQFRARHDQTRVLGLFDGALDVHRTMGEAAVTSALSKTASDLLRSPEAHITRERPTDGEMVAPMSVRGEHRWLAVAGRPRMEPFDDADQALLDALAAVGSGALENSSLYEEVRIQQQRVLAITSSLTEGVCAFDVDGRLVFLNPAAATLLGCEADDILSGTGDELEKLSCLSEPARRALESHTPVENERAVFGRWDSGVFPVEYSCSLIQRDEHVEGAVMAFRDISERIAFEQQLAHHAFHDALTGLPNRRLFLDRLNHALSRTSRGEEVHAVLFADIDRFKMANDSLGHQAGDQLLVTIAERLRALMREGDTLARFGGDEFTVLLENIGDTAGALDIASRVTECLRSPILLDGGRTVVIGASIGIALATAGSSPDDVLHNADVAMYHVKRSGAGGTEVFDETAMSSRSAEWVDLEVDLRNAIEKGEIEVYYQPCYSTSTGRITGAEALVRWRHPTRGLVAPGSFIGLAEETGLIMQLGSFVLEAACRQTREWLDVVDGPFSISVNLSTRQFQANDLVEGVRSMLESTGLPPSRLCLEITESLAFDNLDRSIATISELKGLGVRLAIDDFGTGYSSLTYLRRLPVDVVKLDQSFVMGLETSSVDYAIVAAVVDLARKVGMTTIAEGVETVGQLECLKKMGCPVVQGYLLARPMPAGSFTEQLVLGDSQTAGSDQGDHRLTAVA